MRTRQLLGASAVTALLVVSLAGCVKLDMELQLQSDDTVDGTMVFAMSHQLAELSGQDPADLAQGMQDDLLGSSESEAEVRSEPYDDGEFVGATMFFEGESLDAFAGEGTGESLTIVREGDEFVVSGAMDLSETGGEQLGLTGDPDLRIAVTFPGAVSDHDGTLDGTTVTWVPVAGELTEINARGSAVEGGGGISPLLLGGLVVLALAVVATVVVLAVRSRRTTGSAAAPVVAPFDPSATTGLPGTMPVVAPVGGVAPAVPADVPPAPASTIAPDQDAVAPIAPADAAPSAAAPDEERPPTA